LLWLFWRWGLKSYLPGLASNHDPQTMILPISVSQVARITGMSHCAWQMKGIFLNKIYERKPIEIPDHLQPCPVTC
jgi:hypothetical protein